MNKGIKLSKYRPREGSYPQASRNMPGRHWGEAQV